MWEERRRDEDRGNRGTKEGGRSVRRGAFRSCCNYRIITPQKKKSSRRLSDRKITSCLGHKHFRRMGVTFRPIDRIGPAHTCGYIQAWYVSYDIGTLLSKRLPPSYRILN